MNQYNQHIRILFNEVHPESIINHLRTSKKIFESKHNFSNFFNNAYDIGTSSISENAYKLYARPVLTNNSDNEIKCIYDSLTHILNDTDSYPKYESKSNKRISGFFSLLAEYSNELLTVSSSKTPFCKHNNIMEWREISFLLGQDIFTTSLIAGLDVYNKHTSNYFSWESIIKTDNTDLTKILKSGEGISENHFHLGGSYPIFPITWAYLMNHPQFINEYFADPLYKEYLSTIKSNNTHTLLDLNQLLYYACWARAYLFNKIILDKNNEGEVIEPFHSFDSDVTKSKKTYLRMLTSRLRYHSARFKQPNGKTVCLDYAITNLVYHHNRNDYRFLAGERNFLYNCFKSCYQNDLSQEDKDIFYLYLLIKQRFRGEIIQTNNRIGFKNFLDYQDRKSLIWKRNSAYSNEAIKITLCGTLNEPVSSLELRIGPNSNSSDCQSYLTYLDDSYDFHTQKSDILNFSKNKKDISEYANRKYFTVYSFVKSPQGKLIKPRTGDIISPRNYKTRTNAKIQAIAIRKLLTKNNYARTRVRGIDACSTEIDCRPETFATEFRYLNSIMEYSTFNLTEKEYCPNISTTYHVGEDFLDLIDGLRSIDEVINFIGLKANDRLGHAIALGVDPKIHLTKKGFRSILPSQDLLDNIVWLLCRCTHWDIPISDSLKTSLEFKAEELFSKIYENEHFSLLVYFNSWELRGDNPDIYRPLEFYNKEETYYNYKDDIEKVIARATLKNYDYAIKMKNDVSHLKISRNKKDVLKLLHKYHFSYKTRLAGQKMEEFFLNNEYIEILRSFQNKLIEQLSKINVCIECNPSSNKLIGSFQEYKYLPVFKFNNHNIDKFPVHAKTNIQLRASINTDDKGIFDTSLENEYALIYSVLKQEKDENGEHLFNDFEIYDYIKHLKEIGNNITYPQSSSN